VFFMDELHLWCLAGSRGLYLLVTLPLSQKTIDGWLSSPIVFCASGEHVKVFGVCVWLFGVRVKNPFHLLNIMIHSSPTCSRKKRNTEKHWYSLRSKL